MKHAAGSFEVTLQPLSNAEVSADATFGRFLLTKKFSGDLSAEARGQMLSAGTVTQGSAGYVAIDQVTGTLDGRKGSFVLQHSGTMNRGVPGLSITVVPDSGTAELAGLSGTLKINIVDKKHFYEFEYSLPGN
jgi:Protein of unknown function (DUF3224)